MNDNEQNISSNFVRFHPFWCWTISLLLLSQISNSRLKFWFWPFRVWIWGRIFICVQPFKEQAVSNLDRSMHRSLWVYVAHSSFIEGLHTTKNAASGDAKIQHRYYRVANMVENLKSWSVIRNINFKMQKTNIF
jgi:hypothetical protein